MDLEAGTEFFRKLVITPKRKLRTAKAFKHQCNIVGQSLLSKKIKNLLIAFFRRALFQKWHHIPVQTKPNQTRQCGILESARHSMRAYQKNFSSLGPIIAEKIDPESWKFEKRKFQGFLKKGPQGPPKRSKFNYNGCLGYWGPKWPTKKIFDNFRDGVS